MSAAEIAAILMAVAALSSALIAPWLQRKAEAKRIETSREETRSTTTVGEWRDLYDGVKTENDRLSRRITHLEEEIEELKREHAAAERRWDRERQRLYQRLSALEDNRREDRDNTPPPEGRKR